MDYCNARSLQDGLDPAYEVNGASVSWDQDANGYRLPTEAEWEYACRAGSSSAFHNGGITVTECSPVEPNLKEIGWYCGNASSVPHAVRKKAPNAWGLYDMSGNVCEWCWDWYAGYPAGPVIDPTGPESNPLRVLRGGAWISRAADNRSARRVAFYPVQFKDYLGLRVARWVP